MDLEQLKKEEFDAHVQNGTLRLAFIGMSNAGKSYRSKVLKKEKDFLWFQVDEQIQKALGLTNMNEISQWLGYPTAPSYPEREAKYLALENKFTAAAGMQTHGQNLVFDTTGSVAHLKEETLTILRKNCLMVHLDVGEDSLLHMIEKFFAEPKPVAWCGYFSLQEGEGQEAALRRSYPALLSKRLKHYRSLAHLTIPASEVYNTSAGETLQAIRNRLA